ncbi:hypothetical protein [Paenibacillus planticolens]|nr:hypothetical protein [Paenibacillus planticolens]
MSNSLSPYSLYTTQPYHDGIPMYDERQMMPHPTLLEARQIAPNQIMLTYDQPTDLVSATNISNYWIRSNMATPGTVASVGMGEMITRENTIRHEMGMISPIDNSKMRFIMMFRANATSGVLHVVLPCFVNLEGRTGFTGGNWGPFSKNFFVAM